MSRSIDPMESTETDSTRRQTTSLFVSGVCCSTEEATLRKILDTAIGRKQYTFNLVTCELAIAREVPERNVKSLLRRAGFDARSKQELVAEEPFWKRHGDGLRAVVAGILTAVSLVVEVAGFPAWLVRWRAFPKCSSAVLCSRRS
ncbi:MAG: Cation-transporting P-type ATPase [Bacteroidetes bacterium]|nr:Cation-transporting P-type ATPase [Bacteroidota bacterium]